MKRGKCLDEHFSLNIASSRAPGYLCQQLERALAGAKIRLMQRGVCMNSAHEGNVWEMQALGDHLSADEDINLSGTKIPQYFSVIILALHRIGVHAPDSCAGKKLGKRFLDSLGTRAGKSNCRISAFFIRTNRWDFFKCSTNVADEF